MIVEAGQIALALAFAVSLYAAFASIVGVARRSSELLVSGRLGMYSVPALLLVATAALVYAFVTSDFSVRYVAENSKPRHAARLYLGGFLCGQCRPRCSISRSSLRSWQC